MSNQRQLSNDTILLDNQKYNMKAPFAPGTYIELEITPPQNNIMQWSFVEINSKKALQDLQNNTINIHSLTLHSLLDNNQIPNQQYNVQIFTDDNNMTDINKLGFSLPLTRDNEETFDKYYIVVFAYDTTKQKPTLQDTHIAIDMSFRVGVGVDNNVSESQRVNNNTTQDAIYANAITNNDISEWNKLEHIYSVNEAVWFLVVNLKNRDNKNLSTLDYFRIYPQLAGKIAYIYYRFDLGNEDFITSITSDNGVYVWDRGQYVSEVIAVFEKHSYKSDFFTNGITFKESYGYLFDNKKHPNGTDINFYVERGTFIKRFAERICSKFDLKLDGGIHIDKNMLARGAFDDKSNTIKIRQDLIADVNRIYRRKPEFDKQADRLIATVIHECRHLYIYEKIRRKHHQSPLLNYLAYSLEFYILPIDEKSAPKEIILYQKQCDTNESNAVYCSIGETLFLYEIQPNERDPRYVANEVITRLKIKRKEKNGFFA